MRSVLTATASRLSSLRTTAALGSARHHSTSTSKNPLASLALPDTLMSDFLQRLVELKEYNLLGKLLYQARGNTLCPSQTLAAHEARYCTTAGVTTWDGFLYQPHAPQITTLLKDNKDGTFSVNHPPQVKLDHASLEQLVNLTIQR
jgi:hypothetical protein